MKNIEVSDMLKQFASYTFDEPFKARAFRRAALLIETMEEDIEKVWREKKLLELPGVGEGIAKKIDDFLKHGKSKYVEEMKKKTPIDLKQLTSVAGLGPKTIQKLYKSLKITNVEELKKAAQEHKIQNIKGLGPVVEENIIKNIEGNLGGKRFLLGVALTNCEEILRRLNTLKEIQRVSIAGSLRRMKETVGDIDILATSSNHKKVIDYFSSMQNVSRVLAKGDTKCSVVLSSGIQADLRVVDDNIFGAALLYFTGNQQHNIILRRLAIDRDLKLSEYGLFDRKSNKIVAGKTEEEVYDKLGLPYIEPELREEDGEIEAAQSAKLPKLIGYSDLKGDMHSHTTWSDGTNTIESMALEAKRLGHEYLLISDHSGSLKIANALSEKRRMEQKKEIDKINNKMNGFRILWGTEVNITASGELDVSNKMLKELDVVIASIHSGFDNPSSKMTERIIKAMENENVDIIAHPTGRKLNMRDPYAFDFEKVIDAAKKTGTMMEINCDPSRMDLKDTHVRHAIKSGVKLSIGTDSHSINNLQNLRLGIGIARRGWARKEDIVNSFGLKDILKQFKN